jgi:peptidoglycan/xylan/chitin deacetylase (PgdA/CDA1 family)
MRAALDAVLRLAGMTLYALGLHQLIIRLRRRSPRVLLYHACQPEEDDAIRGLSSNTPPHVLARHLDFLARHYQVVPLSALESGPLPDRAVIITFDDGYRSVYDHAFPLLAARALPAVVYLVTEVVGTDRLVWVNELNWMLRHHGPVARPLAAAELGCPKDATPEVMLQTALATYEPQRLTALLDRINAALPPDAERPPRLYVTWEEVRAMRERGIAFGNHTAAHPNLARLSREAQREEMAAGAACLAQMLEPSASLAYPFGLHNKDSVAAAQATGHRTVMLVGGGRQPLNRLAVGRVPVRATTAAGLFAELEVVAPVRAWLRQRFRREAAA